MNLARFSIQHRSLIWLLVVGVVLWGVFTYQTISRREDPEIKISVALVITVWPGKGAEDIERLVTSKLEDQIEKLTSLEELRSTTRENVSLIFVDIRYDADPGIEWQKLRNLIDAARADMPGGIWDPMIVDDFGDVTAMVWSLSSDTAAPRELKQWAERFKGRLQQLDSVGKVNLLGEQEEAIYIEGPLDSFTTYGFSPLVASKILDYQNVNLPAGYLRTPERNLRLDVSGGFELLEQIREAVIDVSRDTGHPLKVRDVFSVRRAYKEPSDSKVLSDGRPAIGLDVRMQRGHNVVAMGEEVKAVAAEIRGLLPPHVTLKLLHDQPREVDSFINDFMSNLYQGLLIVVVVMFLAMGLRSTLIVAISLPLSIVATIALMPSFGVSLEQVAIASFIIALGMLVDNAIIIVDNVHRRIEGGEPPEIAASEGSHELLKPVLSGTLATVFAFLPLRLLSDEMGEYVRALPVVITISMLASFVLAMTVTPVLAASFLRVKHKPGGTGPGLAARAYARVMRAGMTLRYLVVLGALAGLGGAISLMPAVGMSFFPEVDRDQFTVDVWLPEGSSLTRTERAVRQIEDILDEQPEILGWMTYVGEGGPRFHITVVPQFNVLNYARFMVLTRDKDETRALVDRLNHRLRREITGARVSARNILLGKPVEAPIAVKIAGPDLEVMRELSSRVQRILRETPGTDMVRDNLGQEVRSLKIKVDAESASMVGVSNTEVALALLTHYEGLPVTDFRAEDDKIGVYLRASEDERQSATSLEELSVPSQTTGAKVPLTSFAEVIPEWAPGVIHRVGNRRTVTVLSDVSGRLASQVLTEAWPRIEALELPPGYAVRSEGEQKEREKVFGELTVIFALIIGALLLMLTIQFNAIKQALAILVSVPLAIIGAVLGLYWSGNSFSFMAFLGVISLAGMVIKNAVVWVEFVDRALADGHDLAAAIIDAGIKRFRPIILTAATTIGGLIPLALFGGVLWEGMAWAMIVGLALATVLTLFVIPVIYFMLFKRRGQARPVKAEPTTKDAATTAGLALLFVAAGLTPSMGRAAAPIPSTTHPVDHYVAVAHEHATPSRKARLDIRAAMARRDEAHASFLPIPELTSSVTRLDKEQGLDLDLGALSLPFEIPDMVLVNQNVYRLSGALTLPLYVGGKRFAYLSAAEHGLHAQRRVEDAVTRGVGFGTLARYVQLLEARDLVDVWRDRTSTDRLLVRVAERKLEAGLGVPFDVSYAETMLADSERQLAMALGEMRMCQHAFNDLIGRPLSDPVDLADLGFDPQFKPDEEALADGAHARPELAARMEKAAASRELIHAERADLLPTVAVIGEAGYKDGELGYTDGGGYWMATVALRWSGMLDLGAWRRVDRARVEANRAELEVVEARRALELELAEAIRQHRDTVTIVAVARRGLETAERGRSNAQKAYDQGVLPLATLVEATRALVETRQNVVRASYGRLLTEIQLRYLAGQPMLTDANRRAKRPLAPFEPPAAKNRED